MQLESPELTLAFQRYARANERARRAPFWRRNEARRTLARSRREYVTALIRAAIAQEQTA